MERVTPSNESLVDSESRGEQGAKFLSFEGKVSGIAWLARVRGSGVVVVSSIMVDLGVVLGCCVGTLLEFSEALVDISITGSLHGFVFLLVNDESSVLVLLERSAMFILLGLTRRRRGLISSTRIVSFLLGSFSIAFNSFFIERLSALGRNTSTFTTVVTWIAIRGITSNLVGKGRAFGDRSTPFVVIPRASEALVCVRGELACLEVGRILGLASIFVSLVTSSLQFIVKHVVEFFNG